MNSSYDSFNPLLRSYMDEKGMTRQMLADKSGISVETIKKWMKGERIPSLNSIELLFGKDEEWRVTAVKLRNRMSSDSPVPQPDISPSSDGDNNTRILDLLFNQKELNLLKWMLPSRYTAAFLIDHSVPLLEELMDYESQLAGLVGIDIKEMMNLAMSAGMTGDSYGADGILSLMPPKLFCSMVDRFLKLTADEYAFGEMYNLMEEDRDRPSSRLHPDARIVHAAIPIQTPLTIAHATATLDSLYRLCLLGSVSKAEVCRWESYHKGSTADSVLFNSCPSQISLWVFKGAAGKRFPASHRNTIRRLVIQHIQCTGKHPMPSPGGLRGILDSLLGTANPVVEDWCTLTETRPAGQTLIRLYEQLSNT